MCEVGQVCERDEGEEGWRGGGCVRGDGVEVK